MIKSMKIYITILALSYALISAGNTQIHKDSGDSLLYYLELAAKNNPTVLQRFSEYQAALQKAPQVGSLIDPELSMGCFLVLWSLLVAISCRFKVNADVPMVLELSVTPKMR